MAQYWRPTLRRRLLLAALDAIARVTHLGRRSSAGVKRPEDIQRILVIEPKNIGDVVLTLPFLAALRELFPNARTTMLSNPFARTLLSESNLVDEFIDTNLGWSEAATRYNPLAYNWRELWRLNRDLPARRFDLAFKCCMHIREHIVIGLSAGERRVAYAFGIADRVLTDPIAIDNANRHKAADWLKLLELFGAKKEVEPARLTVSDTERDWARQFLEARGIDGNATIVGVHAGASIPEKRWPLDRFREVVRQLTKRPGTRVLAFVDPQGYGESLGEIESVVTAKVGLRELMALIERCDLLLCNDSGPMHIAGALGVQTVAVFGSGVSAWFAPLGHGHRLVSVEKIEDGAAAKPFDVAQISTARVLSELDAALGQLP